MRGTHSVRTGEIPVMVLFAAVSTVVELSSLLSSCHHSGRESADDNIEVSTGADLEPTDAEVRAYVNRLPKSALEVRVEMEDFLHAAGSVQPSVSDLAYYEAMGDEYNDA